MIIGFTYDLKEDYLKAGFSQEEAAEFDGPATIDGIQQALEALGHNVDRIGHVKALMQRLVRGDRWDLVFNICEGVHGSGREAQVPALLEAHGIPYVFSDVLVLSLTLHKGMAKHVVRDLGIPTAPFALVDSPGALAAVNLPFPLFVKPVAEGTGKGIGSSSLVHDRAGLESACQERLQKYGQSVLVETFLPGREFTVGIVGTGSTARVIGLMEVVWQDREGPGIYSYDNKAHYEERVRYGVPEKGLFEACSEVALAAWRGLGCRDGGRVDLRLDAGGVPHFLEVNPLAGLDPVHSDLPILARLHGIGFGELIRMILDEALARMDGQVSKTTGRPSPAREPDPGSGGSRRVLVLHSPLPVDAPPDELDVLEQVAFFREGLAGPAWQLEVAPFPSGLDALQQMLTAGQPDVVINLTETLLGQGRLVHLAPSLLEALGMPFTGCSSEAIFMTSNKLIAKSLMRAGQIPTPSSFTRQQLLQGAEVPVADYLVKSVWEHASFGLHEDGPMLFRGKDPLLQAMNALPGMDTSWFAEQYIDGREFNLALLGPAADPMLLPVAEMCFSYPPGKPRIVGYKAKWEPGSFEYKNTFRRFDIPEADRGLLDDLRQLARRCWDLFGLNGYARVDFRVDATGQPWVLEVNANPCLSADSGFVAACREAGLSAGEVAERIVDHSCRPANKS
jgi:D-alanine-D-alanine ligase